MTVQWVKPSSGKAAAPKGGIEYLESVAKARQEDAPGEPTLDLLHRAWVGKDMARDRSQQTEIGPSQLGGCRRQTFFRMVGQQPLKAPGDIDRQAALVGTAVHQDVEEAINALKEDDKFTEITLPGIPGLLADGHCDLFRVDQKKVVDWKTPKLKNLKYFPGQQYWWQAHTYGYLATEAGYEVEWVEIIGIVKDGTFADNVSHVRRYDEATALKALDWLKALKGNVADGVIPPADKSGAICRDYCEFYGKDLCLGGEK